MLCLVLAFGIFCLTILTMFVNILLKLEITLIKLIERKKKEDKIQLLNENNH